MRCPKCGGSWLSEKRVGGMSVRVDQCRKCGGLWFDPEELEQVVDVAALELRVLKNAVMTPYICPRCYEVLYEFHYPQTYCSVDMCKKCRGLWLDQGELKEIEVVRGHLRKTGELEKMAPVPGIKGSLIDWIGWMIEELT